MKSIIKIALGFVLVTAAFQGARAALKHYTFVDALQESMLFGSSRNEAQITEKVIELAAEYEIPLDPDLLSVTRDPFLITIEAPYTDTVNLLPGFYARKWDFDASVSVRLLEDTRPRAPSPRTSRRR
jgi:hypothetical protein